MIHRAPVAAGTAVAAAVAAATVVAPGSRVIARAGGLPGGGSAWPFLVLLGVAAAAYAGALFVLGRRSARLAPVAVCACVIQLAPLGAPLLASTDAWTYWAYGWIAARGDGNPYRDRPSAYPASPAREWMGSDWVDTTSVYGPVFTAISEPVALAARDSERGAAYAFRVLAALSILAAAAFAACRARRRALALALVGWNPVLAVHFAGGGHNDALVGALLAAALALAAATRPRAAAAVWPLAVLTKWVPAFLLALELARPRVSGRRPHLGILALVTAVLAALATARYGVSWFSALAPLVENAARETSYAIPARLEQGGLPHTLALGASAIAFLAVAGWLLVGARAGKPRPGLAACLVLATTPYLAVWYLGWALPAVAGDDDRTSRALGVAFTLYLLPQSIPA